MLAGDFCLLARRSGLGLVGTFSLIVNLIMTVCMLNSKVVAIHCTLFDMKEIEKFR